MGELVAFYWRTETESWGYKKLPLNPSNNPAIKWFHALMMIYANMVLGLKTKPDWTALHRLWPTWRDARQMNLPTWDLALAGLPLTFTIPKHPSSDVPGKTKKKVTFSEDSQDVCFSG